MQIAEAPERAAPAIPAIAGVRAPAVRAFLLLVGVSLAAYAGLYAWATLTRDDPFPFGDFFALWSYGQVLAGHPAGVLYDAAALHDLQVALGMPATQRNPFPYPPTFILIIAFAGLLNYTAAYLVWSFLGIALYLASILWRMPAGGLGLPTLLLATTTAVGLVSGQSGFLVAALMIGGFRLLPSHPVAAGVLFGILTYKPQLGILIPVALLSAGYWKTIGSAIATVLVLAAATSLLFGVTIWTDWIHALPEYAVRFDGAMVAHKLMPTVLTNAQALGAPGTMAWAVQLAATAIAIAFVWWIMRGGVTELGVAGVVVATFLATPHAFVYDMPALAGAVVLTLMHVRNNGNALSLPEALVLLAVVLFPGIMTIAPAHLPVSGVLLAAMLLVIGRRHAADRLR